MKRTIATKYLIYSTALASLVSCGIPKNLPQAPTMNALPESFEQVSADSSSAQVNWNHFFNDPYLGRLIDSALTNNQELSISLQEIGMANNEVLARKGEYLPFVGIRAGGGAEKRSENTPLGALERDVDIREGHENPDPMPDLNAALVANWEIDIWKKLRNATKAAQLRYFSSIEGRNFVKTQIVAEIANSYYELLALDKQKILLSNNIQLQEKALDIAKTQKLATRVTELAVKKFEAELLRTKSMQYGIEQKIVETENKINYLCGRYPQHIERPQGGLTMDRLQAVDAGLPADLLENRPDIRAAELEIKATELDVKVAKAKFYPQIGISASLGYQAFNPAYLLKTPQSLIYSLTGDLIAPLINKKAIQADYLNANAKQVQTLLSYQQTIINAYVEVANQLSKCQNTASTSAQKSEQVKVLNQSITIANDLFSAARADYMEVLMTQRDALDSQLELLESQTEQCNAMVNLYRALGGGWK